jgi:hypothetical protein
MSDVITLESLQDADLADSLDEAEVKEGIEGNLAPRGRHEGQIQPDSRIEVITTEEGTHPLEGKKVARVHVILYTEEAGEKHFFFDAAWVMVKATSKKGGSYTPNACTHASYLTKATKLYGQPGSAVLKAAMEKRLVFDIGVKKATDEYPAQNTLRGIYAVSEEA